MVGAELDRVFYHEMWKPFRVTDDENNGNF